MVSGANADVINPDFSYQNRCLKLAESSSFYRRIYSELNNCTMSPRIIACLVWEHSEHECMFAARFEIEEIGWEHLLRLGDDLSFLSFCIIDKKGRTHVMEIKLDKTYPKCPPSIAADVPCLLNLEWSSNSKLKNVVQQFRELLDKLEEFWCALDEIDKSLWVFGPRANRAMSHRQINIGNDCHIMLSINVRDPRSLPECRFLGSDRNVNLLKKKWRINCRGWIRDKSFSENLASVLNIQVPQPRDVQNKEEQSECGICYAQYLPIDDELGARSGSGIDYACENNCCGRAFHSVCLGDWLRSITTTRQSFDVLFGNCPYCSDPVAVKINTTK